MTAVSPTFDQIKAQVTAIRKKIPKARIIGIRAAGKWTGECSQQDGEETYRIEQCDSPLQMRIAMQNDDGVTTTILITNLDDTDLGHDILLRLTKHRLFPIDSWQIVRMLFQARATDPRVAQHGWIADVLLDAIPAEGYATSPGGFLDAEVVWPILLSRKIGLRVDRPDLPALLKWSIDAEHVKRFQTAPEPFRQSATDWLITQAGAAAEVVLHCILSNARPDALAIGLAVGVVFHREALGQLDKAAGRMEERYLGGKTPDMGMVDRWYAAATEVVSLQLDDDSIKGGQLHRADNILREVQAERYAFLSDSSLLGFDQRLAHFGDLLMASMENLSAESLERLTAARVTILLHYQSQHERRRLDRIDMALRLIQWLTRFDDASAPLFQSLSEAATYHFVEGGFVDWARLSLRVGEPVRELSVAYACLLDQVTAIREQQAHRFAELLRDATATESVGPEFIPVERILDDIVVPLAEQAPVLVIVIDGMSVAVYRELMANLTRQDWVALCEEGRDVNRPGLAAVPSVTEVSHTSLLCGKLRQGNAAVEESGFADHAGLLARCRIGSPPILFHKPSLQGAEDNSLAAEVREAIASRQRRVVGVIVNAVDDHLLKGEQIDTRWSRDEIKILPTLLHEARAARRVVVLVSDHGHILEHRTDGRIYEEGGERWRVDDGNLVEGELCLTGRRVVMPAGHQLIAPWTENLRYGGKKNGYHGGVSPQEMVIPIAVLCTREPFPAGWVETSIDIPSWWDEPFQETSSGEETSINFKLKPIEPGPVASTGLGPLFDFNKDNRQDADTTASDTPSEWPTINWIDAFCASSLLAEQKKIAGRAVPADAVIVKLLTALNHHGGKLTSTALARAMTYPPLRLRGLLAVMQRILNIDGYAVLTRDESSDTVELNRELLCQQFDLLQP